MQKQINRHIQQLLRKLNDLQMRHHRNILKFIFLHFNTL